MAWWFRCFAHICKVVSLIPRCRLSLCETLSLTIPQSTQLHQHDHGPITKSSKKYKDKL